MIDCGPKQTTYGKTLDRCLTEAYEFAEIAKAHTACTLIDEALIAACRADLRIAALEAEVERLLREIRYMGTMCPQAEVHAIRVCAGERLCSGDNQD